MTNIYTVGRRPILITQYGTSKVGTSKAERLGPLPTSTVEVVGDWVKGRPVNVTVVKGGDQRNIHPKSAAPPIAGGLEFAMLEMKGERLQASTALDLADLRREEREIIKQLKAADRGGMPKQVAFWKAAKVRLMAKRAALITALHDAGLDLDEAGREHTNRSFQSRPVIVGRHFGGMIGASVMNKDDAPTPPKR